MASEALHFSSLLELANDARRRCPLDDENEKDNPSDVYEKRKDALSAIVLAVAGCESFINELASTCEVAAERNPVRLSDRTCELSRTMPALEEARASVLVKYQAAASILHRQKPDLGKSPFQDFADLIGVRNELAHVKAVSVVNMEGPLPTTEIPRYTRRLLERRKTSQYLYARNHHWMRRLMRRWIADWACESTLAICKHILDGVPDDDIAERFHVELASALAK